MGYEICSGDLSYSERVDRWYALHCLLCIKTTVYNAITPCYSFGLSQKPGNNPLVLAISWSQAAALVRTSRWWIAWHGILFHSCCFVLLMAPSVPDWNPLQSCIGCCQCGTNVLSRNLVHSRKQRACFTNATRPPTRNLSTTCHCEPCSLFLLEDSSTFDS